MFSGGIPGAVVGNGNEKVGLRRAGADINAAILTRDGLVGVAEEVVEHLLKLIGIDQSGG